MKFAIVTPWHDPAQQEKFLDAWGVKGVPNWLFLTQDTDRSGCAATKNKGIRSAIAAGAETIIVLDDDCFPRRYVGVRSLFELAQCHLSALEPQPVKLYEAVSEPESRGVPYFNRTVTMPVAASMGFWEEIPDYDAVSQLVRGAEAKMSFHPQAIFGRYFPWCGMNIAFRSTWWPWCSFVEGVGRMDDIWSGYIWQKEAMRTGHCFNLAGPLVRHSRQSNVWANLRTEAPFMEANETAWSRVHESTATDYETLLKTVKGEA